MKAWGRMKERGGFTLIELLVVIAIISLLASVVLTSVSAARKKGNDARRLSDIRGMITALELYRDKYGNYPCTAGDLSTYSNFMQPLVSEGLLPRSPKDPINSGAYVYFYSTFKASPGGSCGSIVQINYDVESKGSQCIFGGKLLPSGDPNAIHCHLFYPTTTLPCSDPYLAVESVPASDCAALRDT